MVYSRSRFNYTNCTIHPSPVSVVRRSFIFIRFSVRSVGDFVCWRAVRGFFRLFPFHFNFFSPFADIIPPADELFQGYPSALLHFASATCIVFILVGVPGNLITIIALARCKKVSSFYICAQLHHRRVPSGPRPMRCTHDSPTLAHRNWSRMPQRITAENRNEISARFPQMAGKASTQHRLTLSWKQIGTVVLELPLIARMRET